MAESQLTFFVASPGDELVGVLSQYESSVLDGEDLTCFDRERWRLLILSPGHFLHHLSLQINEGGITRALDNNFINDVFVNGALAVIVPAPDVELTFSTSGHGVRGTNSQLHDGLVSLNSILVNLHPLSSPGRAVDVGEVSEDVNVYHSVK